MLSENMIETGSLRRADGRFSVGVRMPWYRALPYSSVGAVRATVDGVDVDPATIAFGVDGGVERPLADLADMSDDWWYVLDSATVSGRWPAVPDTVEHEVEVEMHLYIPYLEVDEKAMMIRELDRKTLRVEEAA